MTGCARWPPTTRRSATSRPWAPCWPRGPQPRWPGGPRRPPGGPAARPRTGACSAPLAPPRAPGCVHVPFGDDEDPATAAARAISRVAGRGDRVGVERGSMYLPVAIWEGVRARLDELDWADGSGIVDRVRAVKSPAEIDLVRRAA